MTSILKVDQLQDSGGNAIITSDGAGNVSLNTTIENFVSTGIDDNATSTAITIDSSENVGIGTASPSVKLEVSDDIAIRGGSDRRITLGSAGTIDANDSNHLRAEGTDLKFNTAGGVYIFEQNGSEAMRITSSGNVGIGTSSPSHALQVSDKFAVDTSNSFGRIYFGRPVSPNLSTMMIQGTDVSEASNALSMINNSGVGMSIELDGSASAMLFNVSGATSERMRIDNSGTLFIGKTSSAIATAGFELYASGFCQQTRSAATVQLFNRTTSDGIIVDFRQQGTSEGNISVSGSTVSYNGFTGTHWSRFQDNSAPTILRGTVLESLDEMCDWYNLEFDVVTQDEDGNDVTTAQKIPHVLTDTQSNGDVIAYNHEGTDVQATIVKEADIKHMKSKVSDTVDAKNVYGVFSNYDLDGEGYNDFYVASVGSFVVRIKQGETIAKGDLLQSNGDGTAKVQSDDNVKSSSFAKVLSTTVIKTYEDGSYLVPCSLMC
jgi:hypothetical protein